jgi:hypothetical protein
MKLSTARVQRTLSQLEEQTMFQDARAIPDDNPAIPRLNELFGDHTFFINGDGLHIVEPAESQAAAAPAAKVVKLASWKDRNRTALTPHQPEATDVLVLLGPDETDGSRRDGRKDETEER